MQQILSNPEQSLKWSILSTRKLSETIWRLQWHFKTPTTTKSGFNTILEWNNPIHINIQTTYYARVSYNTINICKNCLVDMCSVFSFKSVIFSTQETSLIPPLIHSRRRLHCCKSLKFYNNNFPFYSHHHKTYQLIWNWFDAVLCRDLRLLIFRSFVMYEFVWIRRSDK